MELNLPCKWCSALRLVPTESIGNYNYEGNDQSSSHSTGEDECNLALSYMVRRVLVLVSCFGRMRHKPMFSPISARTP